ncbi:unnamed protein product [Miscanthus lutarioriparius]|uniref:BHLH domain-containing protein n=1 Tax=Miscanthus lutarioriparius TaxID=422564 RepID=A0A811SLC7_9POAL|nr:unnamed protein product [Miscanthus lutarioriparius]
MPWHKASNSSCDDSDHLHRQREEQDVVVSSQLQLQLEQIYMLMDMEQEHELHLHHAVPPQSPSQQQRSSPSSSSPFRTFAVSSDETSSLVLSASSATTTFCQQPAQQASSLDTPFSPLPYSYLETIPNLSLEEIMSQARHKDGDADSGTSAFSQYVRHLRPKKKVKPGACGQRAIKTAMSVMAKMHSAKLSQWQRQQSSRTEMTAAAPSDESNNIQLQHLLSERKRREINNSFNALRNALPHSSKRDKTSILMRARDYINSLKSRVSELEEKGMALESQLWIDYGDEQDVNGSPEKIEVGISRAVAEETTQDHCLKIVQM